MLLDELVRTADAVASTRSRLAKVDALARLLRRLEPAEIATAVGLLVAKPRQGRVGIGWRGMSAAMGEPAAEPSLTVADLDAALDRLLATAGAGSAAGRAATLRKLTAAATEREQAFIAGVLLGELRTGALEGVLMDAVASASGRPVGAVRRAAMLSGDLGGTAVLAITGTPADLDAVGLVVGRPVQPMLASTAASASAALEATGEASVEYKLDGARIQVHRSGDDVRIYTRTLAEVTHRLPEVVEAIRGLEVRDVILDGETLALDEDGGPRPFQETMSRFGAEAVRETLLHPWFFDVLHLDGRDLLDEPLSTRTYALEIMPVQTDTFDVVLPVSVSNGLPGAGAGNLETKGSHDQYRFNVPAGGQSVFLDIQSWNGAMRWSLTNTTTGAAVMNKFAWDGDIQLNNLAAGQYTLDLYGTQDAKGTYSLEVR